MARPRRRPLTVGWDYGGDWLDLDITSLNVTIDAAAVTDAAALTQPVLWLRVVHLLERRCRMFGGGAGRALRHAGPPRGPRSSLTRFVLFALVGHPRLRWLWWT